MRRFRPELGASQASTESGQVRIHACDRTAKVVSDRSDQSEGPAAGTEMVDSPEFLCRVPVPD